MHALRIFLPAGVAINSALHRTLSGLEHLISFVGSALITFIRQRLAVCADDGAFHRAALDLINGCLAADGCNVFVDYVVGRGVGEPCGWAPGVPPPPAPPPGPPGGGEGSASGKVGTPCGLFRPR